MHHVHIRVVWKINEINSRNRRSSESVKLSVTLCFPPVVRSATRATVQLTDKMAAAGADAVLVVTPCFFKGKMDSRALIQHFTEVKANQLWLWLSPNKTNTTASHQGAISLSEVCIYSLCLKPVTVDKTITLDKKSNLSRYVYCNLSDLNMDV